MVVIFTCSFRGIVNLIGFFTQTQVYSHLAYAFDFVVFQSDYTEAYTYLDDGLDAHNMETFDDTAKLKSRNIDQISAEAMQVCHF